MKKTKILVADDHAVVRMGLVTLLESESDFEVVGEAGDGAEALTLARKVHPDVILLDMKMPKKDGVAVTVAVKAEQPQTKILILTSFSDTEDISKALDAGAEGILLKNSDYADVAAAIRTVARGEKAVAAEVLKMIAEGTPERTLTERQTEVIDLLARGFTNSEIAKFLGISPDGVNDHIRGILRKLGAANRTEAVAIALRKHLLKI